MLKFKYQNRLLTSTIRLCISNRRKPIKSNLQHIPLRTPYDTKKHIQLKYMNNMQTRYPIKKKSHEQQEDSQQFSDKESKNEPPKQNDNDNNNNNDKNPQNVHIIKYIAAATLIYLLYNSERDQPMLDEHEFLQLTGIQKITVRGAKKNDLYAHIEPQNQRLLINNLDYFLNECEKKNVTVMFDYESLTPQPNTLAPILNMAMIGLMAYWLYLSYNFYKKNIKSGKGLGLGGDMFGFGKMQKQGLEAQITNIRFKDVAGQKEAKQEIFEFVDFLKNPQKDLGARLPRGALLTGPPGTGKTLLAKACAGEAGVPFFYLSGSDFVEMFVGVGASRVRGKLLYLDLFKQAKAKQPSIIFIDEIDAIGRKRESKLGGNDERDSTLNQLLVEMDGFGTHSNVIVMGATNRSELLDPALTRPGRLDRSIEVTLPDITDRAQILTLHLTPLKLNPAIPLSTYAKRLSTLTPGFSGAELHNLCNEAAIIAARGKNMFVSQHHFEEASERIIGGLKKKINNKEEQKIVAYHEAGHAVVSYFLKHGNPLVKVTIIPRSKGALGYAQYLPQEGGLEVKESLKEQMAIMLGGRVSEELFFKVGTSGAWDDFQKCYQVARAMVQDLGMGNMGYVAWQQGDFGKNYSDWVQEQIDNQIQQLVEQASQLAHSILLEKKELVIKFAEKLLELESLDLDHIVDILGERPFPPKQNFVQYLQTKKEIQEEQELDKKQNQEANEKKEQQKNNTIQVEN